MSGADWSNAIDTYAYRERKHEMNRKPIIFLIVSFLCLAPLVLPENTHAAVTIASVNPPVRTNGPIEPEADIIIDAGHGGIDGGTTYGSLLEKDINLAIAKKTYQLLANKGYAVVLNRTGDYALSEQNRWLKNRSRHVKDLAQRGQLANEIKPKALVSLHVNWSKRKSANGAIVLYQDREESARLAHQLQSVLNELYRTNEQPFLGKTYYLLNHSPCPTVIIEMGFISNITDRTRLMSEQGQKEIAAAVTEGLERFLKEME
jgi:N-acetylmuramoyl-L-alanine amidase